MTIASSPPASSAADLTALLGAEAAVRPWWRRPLTWIVAGGLLALAAGGVAWQSSQNAAVAPRYSTEPVTRGNLTLSVTANGTLQPTRSVNIGSELSGTVARVRVDVNDRVKQGQVLVELDTAKLSDQITRSRASLAAAQAQQAVAAATAKEAEGNLGRLEAVARLSGGKVPSQSELDTGRAALDRARAEENSARAAVTNARAALSTDETNLAKASIRSPIDGVVLTRTVEPGNAVAASLQAVTLLTLAEDLSQLRLQVNVDEADVGSVALGQPARFTVAAHPSRTFPATLTRVAFGSTITENVVTYLTWLDVANADLSLRPGMTATATITAIERRDVLRVPTSALRFTPTAAAVQASGASTRFRQHRLQADAAPAGQRHAQDGRRGDTDRRASGLGAAERPAHGGGGHGGHQRRPLHRSHRRRPASGRGGHHRLSAMERPHERPEYRLR